MTRIYSNKRRTLSDERNALVQTLHMWSTPEWLATATFEDVAKTCTRLTKVDPQFIIDQLAKAKEDRV